MMNLRSSKMDVLQLIFWLMVPAGIIHVGEETYGHFIKWFKEFTGFPISVTEDIVVNIIFIAALAIGAYVSNTSYLVFSLGAVGFVFINFWFHVAGTIKLKKYSPGFISAALLYLPLSLYIYYASIISGYVDLLGMVLASVIALALYFGCTYGIHILYVATKRLTGRAKH